MTADRSGGRPRPFGPDELDGVTGIQPDELAAETRLARDLEVVASRGGVRPSAGFTDRVMGAIAAEPVPAPAIAAGSALRHGAALGFLASIRDSFRVAFGGGFPVAARAQAMALVLVVAGVVAGSGLATAGALGMLDDRQPPSPYPSVAVPSPTETPEATPAPTDTPAATFPAPSPSPWGSLEPAESEAVETPEPAKTEDTSGATKTATPRPVSTPKPTRKPTPMPTGAPTEEPEESHTPKPSKTPEPDHTPSPSPSPMGD